MKKIRVATVFSGVGAIEQALRKRKMNNEIVFACDTGERYIDKSYDELLDLYKKSNEKSINTYIKKVYENTKKPNHVKKSYFANYDIDESRWYDDIRFIDGNKYKGKVDLFVGGSPCQSFSIIGKRAGLNDARGTLFYDFARLIKEIEPEVFIYENVLGMLSHDKGNTWKHIKEIFESLEYDIHFDILNSMDFGIPQNRKRIFVVGFKKAVKGFKFPTPINLEKNTRDYLEDKVETRHYVGKKGFEFITNIKYRNRARINESVIQTQKANQQFNWNGDFIFEKYDKRKHSSEIMNRAHLGMYEGEEGVIRQLSYRECFRLMGFSDDFKIVVPNVAAYRQAGNSIVVNVLEYLMMNIVESLEWDKIDDKQD